MSDFWAVSERLELSAAGEAWRGKRVKENKEVKKQLLHCELELELQLKTLHTQQKKRQRQRNKQQQQQERFEHLVKKQMLPPGVHF